MFNSFAYFPFALTATIFYVSIFLMGEINGCSANSIATASLHPKSVDLNPIAALIDGAKTSMFRITSGFQNIVPHVKEGIRIRKLMKTLGLAGLTYTEFRKLEVAT